MGREGFGLGVESFGAAVVERWWCFASIRVVRRQGCAGVVWMGNCVAAGACGRDEWRSRGEGPA